MDLSIIIFFSIFALIGGCYILWLKDVRPFVKKYTGGKAHGWWWQTSIFQDYFLAKRIIKEKGAHTPTGIRLIKAMFIAIIVLVVTFAIQINQHNQSTHSITGSAGSE
jgi:hypothetical protein